MTVQPRNSTIPCKILYFLANPRYHSLCSAYASPARIPNLHPLLSNIRLCPLPARGTCPDPPGI